MPIDLHVDLNSGQRPPRSLEGSYHTTLSTPGKPLRFERISGLSEEQIDELERRVVHLLERPWQKKAGRPRGLTLREALVVTCGYLRQNITEEVWADVFGVSQATVSRCITLLTPLAEQATARERPSRTAAVRAVRGAIALADGRCGRAGPGRGRRSCGPGSTRPQATAR